MESIYLLIPVSVILVFAIAVAFWWSVRSGQFYDLEGPGFRLLMDDDVPKIENEAEEKDKSEKGLFASTLTPCEAGNICFV